MAGLQHIKHFGLTLEELNEPPHGLQHAVGSPLKVLGSYPVSVMHNGQSADTEVYFAQGVKHMYLSLDVCKKINVVHKEFLHVDLSSIPNISNITIAERVERLPSRPAYIPYSATEENIPKLEAWLQEKFSSTTFNTTDPLPLMSGKPHKFHLKENAIPFAAHTPIPIPHHWKDEVKRQLEKDTEMGIIRRAPIGEPTEWCMRMVTVSKKDGTPRRTIDFQPINKYCERETHHTPRPFDVVSNIPPTSYKTVLDAYNGYHQVPLDEESSKLTTFITEFGRFQYLRAPQGHLASGDAYTRHYNDIISDVPRKHKIVDDVLLYDKGIEEAFYHVFDYLYLCGENGITIHPGKFKFAQSQVDFVGYSVGWDDYKPSDDMLSAIRNFPMPDNPSIADIRSWFGLVNQVALFLATAPVMALFRDLLKPSNATAKKVYWDSELQQLFESTKSDISELASRGLAYYDTNRRTAVITDWSKKGIGFVIMQKHCNCVNDINDQSILSCCKQGWRLAFCHSRHLDQNEQEYAPIEGEALAVCWALKKARLFLLGCPHFEVIIDHNPLLKIFGDKCLNDILNPRLFDFKEKTLPYSFTIRYIKGIKNHANTFSRYPVGGNQTKMT